jgi:hypothetical protein
VLDGGLEDGMGILDGHQSLFSGGLRCPLPSIAAGRWAIPFRERAVRRRVAVLGGSGFVASVPS